MRLLLTGTGTDVGKTWVGAALLRSLRVAGGVRVAAVKPAQSFVPGEGPTDAEVLAEATGQHPYEVCPRGRWYEVPLAPPEAADELGLPPFTLSELVLPEPDAELVAWEGAGGPRSPLACDGDTVSLARLISPDLIVLVAPAGLGAINDVRLSAAAFDGIAPLVVFLNRFDPSAVVDRRNLAFLRGDGFEVVTDVHSLERLVHVLV